MEQKFNRKIEIIGAAKALFAKNGYAAVSMDDIADKVGIAKASLYYFFKGKEEIFSAIIEETINKIKRHLDAEMKVCRPGQARLAKMIDQVISICLENGIVIRPVDVKAANLHPIVFEKVLPMLMKAKKNLRRALECYGAARADLAAEVLVNSVHAYVLQTKHGLKVPPQKEYADYLATLFIKQ